MKKFLIFISCFICLLSLNAQVRDKSNLLYDDSEVAVIKITMDSSAYSYMISNPEQDSLHICKVYFKNAFIDDTVFNAGIRIRGNTSRQSRKVSFKISFDDFEPGREFYGVSKMNLNGEHNDPSISRAKICWDLFNDIGLKASRVAHAVVYINNVYHGIYISVEHVDKKFLKRNYYDPSGNLWKCLYPADLTFRGNLPSDYYYTPSFTAYELKTNESENDYSSLVRLIKIINNTPKALFADSLESVLVVPEYLKYQVMNIILGSWDDYWALMNNYYIYFDPSIRKFHWIPYDYDNTFGVDWFNIDWTNANPYSFPQVVSGARPLIVNILNVPEYRNLFTHFLQFYSTRVVTSGRLEPKIDKLKNILSSYAQNDYYRTLDYNFTYDDFLNSFDKLEKLHVKKGIKEFISQRSESLQNQLAYMTANPVIYNITHVNQEDSICVFASAFDNQGIKSVNMVYSTDGGNNLISSMRFSPVNTTMIEDADRWMGKISLAGIKDNIAIKFEVTDSAGNSSFYPRNEPYVIKSYSGYAGVVINEILADNSGTIEGMAGDKADWIELYNSSGKPVPLTGMYLTDERDVPMKWKITQPELKLNPGNYIIIRCDDKQDQPGLHTNFKLSKEGEFIGLAADDGTTWIDSLTFGKMATDISYSRIPDGSSTWGFSAPTPGSANVVSGINDITSHPVKFNIAAYPNPFNPVTNIYYSIPFTSDVNIRIYDILGNEVWNYLEENKLPGKYTVLWNAENKSGVKLSSGMYFCRITTDKFTGTYKLMLLK